MSEKFKINRNLATVLDADGNIIKVEAREDVEQDAKFEEIIDLLVAAGYFRARIKGLSPFDKVVGGIVWCIDSCDVDIDVELLFQDDLTIGQKISLTEKIVVVLPRIKCPHRIEPHQIQGLDFIHIFPVVQWLVKRAMETREERSEYLKNNAVSQFHKQFSFSQDQIKANHLKTALSNIQKIQEKHGAVRKYRRKGKQPAQLLTRVESTLLEYGSVLITQNNEDTASDHQKLEEDSRKELLKSLVSTSTEKNHFGTSDVENVMSMQVSKIMEAAAIYAELQSESETSNGKKIKLLEEKIIQLERKNEGIKKELEEAEETLTAVIGKNEAFENKKIFSEEEEKHYNELYLLVKKNEDLKSQEMSFKEQCKSELVTLQNLLSETEEMANEVEDDTKGVKQQLLAVEEKIKSTRLELGKKTRVVSTLERKVDQVPDNAELAQYQLRFMELYDLVAAKHLETKQFYTRYNTLSDILRYLNKEFSLLNSITENFSIAMSNSDAKKEFMSKLDKIVEDVESNKQKVEKRRNEEKKQCDKLHLDLSGLQEIQRQYVSALKQLSDEYGNN